MRLVSGLNWARCKTMTDQTHKVELLTPEYLPFSRSIKTGGLVTRGGTYLSFVRVNAHLIHR